MITRAATAAILADLVERKTIESKVMIVVTHPDDETIGMGAQLCRFRDALMPQAIAFRGQPVRLPRRAD